MPNSRPQAAMTKEWSFMEIYIGVLSFLRKQETGFFFSGVSDKNNMIVIIRICQ
ncbi:MAG: hypothetical protein H7844_05090 [Nitrospirae bacterium YQR-1]